MPQSQSRPLVANKTTSLSLSYLESYLVIGDGEKKSSKQEADEAASNHPSDQGRERVGCDVGVKTISRSRGSKIS